MAQSTSKAKLAEATWNRYSVALSRGHADFQLRATRCEDFYIGGGRQWDLDVIALLESEQRPWLESNLIFSVVNSVVGYQTQSRLDIAYKPKETGDQEIADVLSKIGMHILDDNKFPWLESEAFADGIIQSRGFFDVRMEFNSNMMGNVAIEVRDPLDIIPDPDAKSYDPDQWADVIETRWMTIEDIKENYGNRIGNQVSKHMPDKSDSDFGIGEEGATRNKFSGKDDAGIFAYTADESGVEHVRVLERQFWKMQLREFFVDSNGDMTPVPEDMGEPEKLDHEQNYELYRTKKVVKRVRWTTATKDIILHDDWSPYDHFTIIPFFPYFRRGVTIGLVDNLISIQEMYNKTLSQELHVINAVANSGWIIYEDSLLNKEIADVENEPAKNGEVFEIKKGHEPPAKIQPNQIPTGLSKFGDDARGLISQISGVSEIFQGQQSNEVSGAAIQSRVQQNAVQLAAPLDNMYRTRHMIAQRLLELVQDFYTEERVFNVTLPNEETGEEEPHELVINQAVVKDDVVQYLNDTTQGKYDVVISDVPDQVTFQNSQFAQAVEMRKFGVEIPDDIMVRLSSLSNKNEIAKRMQGSQDPEEAERQARAMEAEVRQKEEDVEKTAAETVSEKAKSLSDLVNAATSMAANPAVGAVAQAMATGIGLEPPEGNEALPEEPLPPDGLGQQMSPEEQMAMQAQQQMGGAI